MPIRTKIIATIGPACGTEEKILELAKAGCDVFRINFSHGTSHQREEFLRNVRAAERSLGEPLAVMADLCGPKIRVGQLKDNIAQLEVGQELVIQRSPILGDGQRISTTLAELVDEVGPGHAILLADGTMRLEVIDARPPDDILCRVLVGGQLRSGKGVNLPDTELSLSALTEKDRLDAAWIAERDFDYVALSFVRAAQDVVALRELLRGAGSRAHIIAKIEKPQAVTNIASIVDVADGVMVARGDLGVEMELPAVPVAQKRIAQLCQEAGKPCIIATQMLETMTTSVTPTRAEVSDVANAVLDHADAVMLSAETAMGDHPRAAVVMMNDIVHRVEAYHDQTACPSRVVGSAEKTVAALASAVRVILETHEIAAVAVFTASGTTARLLAKSRLCCPILAMSEDLRAMRRAGLYYGVEAVHAKAPLHTREILSEASDLCQKKGIAKKGQYLVVLSGRPIGEPGATNTLVIHQVR